MSKFVKTLAAAATFATVTTGQVMAAVTPPTIDAGAEADTWVIWGVGLMGALFLPKLGMNLAKAAFAKVLSFGGR
ncbi:hypothetical protein [Chitinimonas taiwanensis]|uniref:Bacteriophage coat protein B n=1 Tax=Chitinimonas taiwanensis DSM 18899 TaxID=1121279 RepID=A0A1K2HMZ7_9NEIS|nr:hypothetical protein [Chitinimonas taiwanensis]SFZ77618.1 hypothetical protein SAMN02745887_02524 [Chitinimonas taiwanensis DSM 18899]